MGVPVSLVVNGAEVQAEVEPGTLLVDFLRGQLTLTGTHVGCDTAQCGACTVLVDGRAVKSCNVLAAQVAGSQVTTIEGLASDGALHPMQAAFRKHHGLQCGFCTPGMVMNAIELATTLTDPTDERVREAMDGNFCRCTGYQNIVKAVKAGIEEMA